MNIFPTITKKKQEMYEKIYLNHTDLQNNIPCICGYYGRACRNMDDKANSMLCNGCTLSLFISTMEAILEHCKEKENIGIEHLYDSDVYDIQEKLREKTIKVNFSYIRHVLDYLKEGYMIVQNIVISKKEIEFINNLLNMTGEEIYQKYGYKKDETIIHTAKFPNGIEADIKLVICEEESPYTEGVLFQNGFELTYTEPDDTYEGEWIFKHNGIEYIVNIIVGE